MIKELKRKVEEELKSAHLDTESVSDNDLACSWSDRTEICFSSKCLAVATATQEDFRNAKLSA